MSHSSQVKVEPKVTWYTNTLLYFKETTIQNLDRFNKIIITACVISLLLYLIYQYCNTLKYCQIPDTYSFSTCLRYGVGGINEQHEQFAKTALVYFLIWNMCIYNLIQKRILFLFLLANFAWMLYSIQTNYPNSTLVHQTWLVYFTKELAKWLIVALYILFISILYLFLKITIKIFTQSLKSWMVSWILSLWLFALFYYQFLYDSCKDWEKGM